MMWSNRFLSSPRLRTQHIGRTGRGLSLRTMNPRLLSAGNHSCRPARHNAIDWLYCIVLATLYLHWQVKIQLESQRWTSSVHRRQCESHFHVCVHGTDGNVITFVIVWAVFHYGAKSKLVVLDGTMNHKCTDVCCDRVFYPRQEPSSGTTLSQSKIMLCPTQPEPLGISWRTRTWTS